MTRSRTYPEGVTSWVDVEPSDIDGAIAFYSGLFGWTFADAAPPGAPSRYVVAQLGGRDVAGIGTATEPDGPGERAATWNTYVAVDDPDAAAARVQAAGGRVLRRPTDAGQGGRYAICADPAGVAFRLWQAGGRPGAQVVNTPGAWNFSDLHAVDPASSAAFYTKVFGWSVDDLGFATMIRLPGYGDHLQATIDPEIHARQAAVSVPPGFADSIGWLAPTGPDEPPHWHVTFSVDDRDAIATEAERIGASVLDRTDSQWTRDALIRDPQGAVFTVSQFTPPSG
jgi:predicted enzyme related to lactoylglutathione lyase